MTSNSIFSKALVYGGIAALAASGARLPATEILLRAGMKAVGKPAEAIANEHNQIQPSHSEEENPDNINNPNNLNGNGRKVNLAA